MTQTETVRTGKKQRNMGIELLRVVSMMMVVLLHLVGVILPAENDRTHVYEYVWLLESGAFCAVNCYAMISGYVDAGARTSLGRALNLWLQVAFYTLGIAACESVIRPELVGKAVWMEALMPISHGAYWYMSAYFGLMLLMPLLSLAVKNASPGQLGAFSLGALLIYSAAQFVEGADWSFCLTSGYSLMWLVILYLVGAYLARSELLKRVRAWQALAVYVLSVGITWALKMAGHGEYINYVSPTVFLAGAALTLFFAKLQIRAEWLKKGINFLAAGSLGVYLIHINPVFYAAVTGRIPVSFPGRGGLWCVLLTLASAAALFAFCEALDWLRRLLFRAVRLDRAGNALDSFISRHFTPDRGRG